MDAPDRQPSGPRDTRKRLPVKNAQPREVEAAFSVSRRPLVDAQRREEMIRAMAYRRAESRGFSSGRELDDWLAAEAEIDEGLAHERAGQVPARGDASQ